MYGSCRIVLSIRSDFRRILPDFPVRFSLNCVWPPIQFSPIFVLRSGRVLPFFIFEISKLAFDDFVRYSVGSRLLLANGWHNSSRLLERYTSRASGGRNCFNRVAFTSCTFWSYNGGILEFSGRHFLITVTIFGSMGCVFQCNPQRWRSCFYRSSLFREGGPNRRTTIVAFVFCFCFWFLFYVICKVSLATRSKRWF